MKDTSSSSGSPINELAYALAANHFDMSFPSKVDRQRENCCEARKAFPNKHDWGELRELPSARNILVVGAGASLDAIGTHRGDPCIKAIWKLLTGEDVDAPPKKSSEDEDESDPFNLDKIRSKYRKKELTRIQRLHGEQKPTFETRLSVLQSEFGADTLQDVLVAFYGGGRKYRPSLLYDTVAHMFLHRFLDVIINFNFDEALDQAITEEMGKAEYRRIVSDADCGSGADFGEEFKIDGRLRIPIYIKPHGTVSDYGSLRFTKDDYFQVPRRIMDLMSYLLNDPLKSHPSTRAKRVNLITIGFNMASVEFNTLLHDIEKKGNDLHFYHFGGSLPASYLTEANKAKTNRNLIKLKYKFKYSEQSLTARFLELWKRCQEIFEVSLQPRGLYRHHVIASLFNERRDGGRWEKRSPIALALSGGVKDIGKALSGTTDNQIKREPYFLKPSDDPPESRPSFKKHLSRRDYFLARAATELALAVLIGKGVLKMPAALQQRFGIYYKLYKKESEKEEEVVPASAICEALGLEQIGSHGRAFWLFKEVDASTGSASAAIDDLMRRAYYAEGGKDLKNYESDLETYQSRVCSLITKLTSCLCRFFEENLDNSSDFDYEWIETDQDWYFWLARIYDTTYPPIRVSLSDNEHYLYKGEHLRLSTHLALTSYLVGAFDGYVPDLREKTEDNERKKVDWDCLLVAVERGHVLWRFGSQYLPEQGKKISLITAQNPQQKILFLDDMRRRIKTCSAGEVYAVPPEIHHRHMSVFLRKIEPDKDFDRAVVCASALGAAESRGVTALALLARFNLEPVQGTVTLREGTGNFINPLHLVNYKVFGETATAEEEDFNILIEHFAYYRCCGRFYDTYSDENLKKNLKENFSSDLDAQWLPRITRERLMKEIVYLAQALS